ncbi:phospholipase D family protein [Piscinibacter koreensis]|uniref:Phospholipase D family protein n=1 Tax=Piscinibacter koreensis TaxID=2742824 RepID=A0A7Y6NTJ5_9BURK|nr:phospholipase D family protein [Schlegelella koreensis]NUZ09070.1 phospholipase D family protein [Schlegelella koreensis]
MAVAADQPTHEKLLSGFRLLPSGPAALTARLELVRRAERSLDLQYFMFRGDQTGLELLRLLRDAAARGVRVRLLIDDLYAPSDELLLSFSAHDNVEVRLFNPFALRNAGLGVRFATSLLYFEQLNHRMHNKLFLADGVIAITGGRNIADEYFSRSQSANFVDLDVLAAGPIVASMSGSFDAYWNSELAYPLSSVAAKPAQSAEALRRRFDMLAGAAVAPERALPEETDVLGRSSLEPELRQGRLRLLWSAGESFADSPQKGIRVRDRQEGQSYGQSAVRLNAVALMRAAKSEIILTSPYLVPGLAGVGFVKDLTRRGVTVRILTNSLASTDQPLVHGAYGRYRVALLQAGADLYELSPKWIGRENQRRIFGSSAGGLHTKSLVIDKETVVVGSMNFDPRSNHFNTESSIVIRSPELGLEAAQLARISSLEGAHRLHLTEDNRLNWAEPVATEGLPHTSEPEASLWLRIWLRILAVLAPESLL